MNSQLTTITREDQDTFIFAITPKTIVFQNTIRTRRFWRRKNRQVTLRWSVLVPDKKSGQKSFYPILEDTDGFELASKESAETHLEKEIVLPKIIEIRRSAVYQGCCNICGRFHLDDRVLSIQIIGEEEEIFKKDFSLPDDLNEHLNTKCTNLNCKGWVPKKLVLGK